MKGDGKHKTTPLPALLLAAGLGTRMGDITKNIPKCLAPIQGEPLLGYWFSLLGHAGVAPVIVNTHHHAEMVRRYVAQSPWRNRVTLVHEEELLGTGGTLLRNREQLAKSDFLVIHADNLSRFNLTNFLEAHENRPRDCVVTMMLFRTPTPQNCGIVELDSRGVVVAFHEKSACPPGNLANAAVYMMDPAVFPLLEKTGKSRPDISLDLIPQCLGRVYTWLNDDYHRDIGTPESYALAQTEFPGGRIEKNR